LEDVLQPIVDCDKKGYNIHLITMLVNYFNSVRCPGKLNSTVLLLAGVHSAAAVLFATSPYGIQKLSYAVALASETQNCYSAL
jgi:hypothetical protein